jgi:hypothetical protein
MADIRSEAELRKALEGNLERAINNASVKVSKILLEQIKKDVYTEQNTWYERSGEFENAFTWKNIQRSATGIAKELFYNHYSMQWIPFDWRHGNPERSAVENLADILNLAFKDYQPGYTSGKKFGNRYFSHYRRPYWKNFIERLFEGGEIEKILTEELRSAGLNVTKI